MTQKEREELVIKLNDIRLGLKKSSTTDETSAEIVDLINTILSILTK